MVFISFFGEPSQAMKEKALERSRLASPNYPMEAFGLTFSLAQVPPSPPPSPSPSPSPSSSSPPSRGAPATVVAAPTPLQRLAVSAAASADGPSLSTSTRPLPEVHVGTVSLPGQGHFLWLHSRTKVGKGKQDFERCRELLQQWRQFSLPWTKVYPACPALALEPGRRLCVAARSLFAWTINPLKVLYVHYQHKGNSRPPHQRLVGAKRVRRARPQAQPGSPSFLIDTPTAGSSRGAGAPRGPSGADWEQAEIDNLWTSRWGAPLPPSCRSRFAVGVQTLQGHFLGGEERFSVDWTASDDVILEVMSFSRPANLLSVLAYPLAAYQQYQFMKEGAGAVASYMEQLQQTRDGKGKK